MGGISFLLYGMIAASGLRLVVDQKVNYGKPRNLASSSIVLITGLSNVAINIGSVKLTGMCLTTTSPSLSASSSALARIVDRKAHV